jgi:hypothetical protein
LTFDVRRSTFDVQNSGFRIQEPGEVYREQNVHMNPKAEQIRIRYLYRRLVLNGDVKVSKDTAKKMVGPDCAYQLYGKIQRDGLKSRVQRPESEETNGDQ